MSDEAVQPAEEANQTPLIETPEDMDETHYQAVEKEGVVTAIWEMRGRKHVRTIRAPARANRSSRFLKQRARFSKIKTARMFTKLFRGHSCFFVRRQKVE